MPDIDVYRRELAAAFRLAAKFEDNEGICNHFSVQVPGQEERYLFNPYGVHWSEMRPADLLLVDGDGADPGRRRRVGGDSAQHPYRRPSGQSPASCLLHTHMPWATSLTMVEGGQLEMAHQTAARFYGRTAYNDEFGGFASGSDEGERIASTAKSDQKADIVFLAHHGIIVGGPSVATAFDDLYFLDRACRQQVLAMSTGKPLKLIPQQVVESTAREWMAVLDHQAKLHFDALMRINGL